MSTIAVKKVKLGDNADLSKNFLIEVPAVADGTLTIKREDGTSVLSIDANGKAVIPGVVGTVAQVGGVPTGQVVERGSNANGEYVRFADGTQICQIANVAMGSTQSPSVLYYSNEVTWTFPAAFANRPCSVVGSDSGSTRLFGTGTCHSATQSFIILVANASYSNRSGYFTAIGRWF